MLESFAFSLLLNLVIALLSPKPKFPDAKKYGLGELDVPTATEDRAQTIGWGTFQSAGNVIWFGDYRADAVKEDVDTSLFTSTSVTRGYEYRIGLWMTLCGTTCDRVQEVRYGDRVLWAGDLELSKTGVTVLDVNGRYKDTEDAQTYSGLAGRFLFFNHRVLEGDEYTPLRNVYMEQQLGGASKVPAYPNTLHCVFLGPSADLGASAAFVIGGFLSDAFNQMVLGNRTGFVGSGPNISPLKFTLSRMPDLTDAFPDSMSVTYPLPGPLSNVQVRAALEDVISATQSVEGDANPALVELEVLTSRVPGLGPKLYPWAIDTASYLRAAQAYAGERHGVSFAWETSRAINELLADLAEQTQSTRETDERTGRIRTKLVREGDAVVAAFDESNIIELQSFTRTNPDTAPNRITVPFVDRGLNWVERVAIAKNPAGAKAAGGVIDYRADFLGVSRADLAGLLASREARRYGSALARASWTGVVAVGTILKPFDLVTLKHPRLGITVRMRVVSARFASYSGRLRVELEAVEDVFRSGIAGSSTISPPPVSGSPDAPTALTSAQLQLAPYALHGDEADHLIYSALDSDTATDTYRVAYQEASAWVADSTVSYADTEQEPAIVATLSNALLTTDYSTNVALVLTDAAKEQWKRATRGRVYLTIGSEWLSCSSWSLAGNVLTAQGIVRGLFDTIPGSFAAGAAVRLMLGYVVLPKRCKTHTGGGLPDADGYAKLTVRAESRGPGGVLGVASTAASAASWDYAEGSTRASLPLPPHYVRLNATIGSLAEVETPPVLARASSVQLTFLHRNRLARSTAGYYDQGNDYEAGTQVFYRLEWESNTPGAWSWNDGEQGAGVGVSTVSINTASVTAGARRLRARVSVRRATAGGYVSSTPFYVYWKFGT